MQEINRIRKYRREVLLIEKKKKENKKHDWQKNKCLKKSHKVSNVKERFRDSCEMKAGAVMKNEYSMYQ